MPPRRPRSATRARRPRKAWPRLRWPRRWPRLPVAAWTLLVVAVLAAADLAWQVARKPTELLGLVAPPQRRTPEATWSEYGPLFGAHATEVITPELLAALAQVESAGDPLARTYWRWQWSWNPLEVYGPASSAVGLLQLTDGAFEQARRLCIHDHAVAHEGPWTDPRACWFNGLYFRTVPSHAIEMTAALLHQSVAEIVAGQHLARATPAQLRRLAAVVHLCGKERAAVYARRGFRALPGERCGDHELAAYVARVEALEAVFARLAAASPAG